MANVLGEKQQLIELSQQSDHDFKATLSKLEDKERSFNEIEEEVIHLFVHFYQSILNVKFMLGIRNEVDEGKVESTSLGGETHGTGERRRIATNQSFAATKRVQVALL